MNALHTALTVAARLEIGGHPARPDVVAVPRTTKYEVHRASGWFKKLMADTPLGKLMHSTDAGICGTCPHSAQGDKSCTNCSAPPDTVWMQIDSAGPYMERMSQFVYTGEYKLPDIAELKRVLSDQEI